MTAGNPLHPSPTPLAASADGAVLVPWDRFERFVGQFSHDVRNGLNALELQLTFLGEISTDPEAVEEVKRLRRTLGDMTRQMQAVKIATGPAKPSILDYPAADLFDDLRERLAKLFPEAAAKTAWHIELDPALLLLVDPDLTIGGLLELFANTVHFAATSVQCRAASDADTVSFILQEVSAAAPPIPPVLWGRTPLHSTRRGAYGLGLFRVHRILESQGGKMQAEYSPEENLLTTTVTLPRTGGAGSRA